MLVRRLVRMQWSAKDSNAHSSPIGVSDHGYNENRLHETWLRIRPRFLSIQTDGIRKVFEKIERDL